MKDEDYLTKIKDLQRKIIEQEIEINSINMNKNTDQTERIKVNKNIQFYSTSFNIFNHPKKTYHIN